MDQILNTCGITCATLTLPVNTRDAHTRSRVIGGSKARDRSHDTLAQVVRNRGSIALIAPTYVVHGAVRSQEVETQLPAAGEEENKSFQPRHGGDPTHHNAIAGRECGLCRRELQVDNTLRLCGDQFCTECAAGFFNTESDALPALPSTCAVCSSLISVDEVSLFAPGRGLRRFGESTRSSLVTEVDDDLMEQQRCPNRQRLGLSTAPTANPNSCHCSGCGLTYCAACARSDVVRTWREGEHYTAADTVVDRLIQQLPLLPRCPECTEPLYSLEGCGAIKCTQGHALCGFYMRECADDAHEDARQCERNPRSGVHLEPI